jgi:hypothetical protein
MAEERDRNDPELKYLSVERNAFNDPATQAEWTQKRLVWVPHENQVRAKKIHISSPRLWIRHRNFTPRNRVGGRGARSTFSSHQSHYQRKVSFRKMSNNIFCLQPTINSPETTP